MKIKYEKKEVRKGPPEEAVFKKTTKSKASHVHICKHEDGRHCKRYSKEKYNEMQKDEP